MAIDRSKIQKQADGFVAAGKIDRAIEEFSRLLEDKPGDLLMMNRIGDLYLQSGKVRDALDMFKRAAMGYERDGFLPTETVRECNVPGDSRNMRGGGHERLLVPCAPDIEAQTQ